MSAVEQAIKAAQEAAAARASEAEAAAAMQTSIFADARVRVDVLVREFNELSMELKEVPNGPPGSYKYPLTRQLTKGPEYKLLGKGLRFYLLWAPDGRHLVLTLNAVCRYANDWARGRDRAAVLAAEASTELLGLEEMRSCLSRSSRSLKDSMDYQPMGYITRDGRYGLRAVPYDDKEHPEFICPSPAAWMTSIITGPDIAPFVVLP